MENMFCFQCEQSANRKTDESYLGACTISGVCGKKPIVSLSQDLLTCEMIALASVAKAINYIDDCIVDLISDGLFITLTNVNFDDKYIDSFTEKVKNKRLSLGNIECTVPKPYDLFHGEVNTVSLKSTLLFGLRGMAAYAHHARILNMRDSDVDAWFVKGMATLNENHTAEEWLALLMEFGSINLKCMELLDIANTKEYGNPTPTEVTLTIEKGPFIVISGHDLKDIKLLLEQTQGKGINIYTHSEMLPAHGYPELKKYTHLKGNFGTAWQSQQNEFENIPAPVLFTTNCLMPPKISYKDRIYTTSVVGFPELKYIEKDENGNKDFSVIIEHALQLGGYSEDVEMCGINGGKTVTTGFGRQTILDNAPTIIDAVKNGAIKHFFLVGGCDGAKTGRNYYTEFAKKSPNDSLILTLACGKFRINDLDIGKIGPFPRILDMGQCNDAYGAVKVALALADAFNCTVNELPLTLVLSWYEQKAVCILLTLLSLGIKNIYIGPSIPTFFSDDVLNILVEQFKLTPIKDAEGDLNTILSK